MFNNPLITHRYTAYQGVPSPGLENVESIKYLGVTITNDLKWNTHISNVCTKANRTLGFLRRNLYSCPPDVKEAAYKFPFDPGIKGSYFVLFLFSCYSHQSISDYSWEVYIVHSGVFAG